MDKITTFKRLYVNMRNAAISTDTQLRNGVLNEQAIEQGIEKLDELIAMLPFSFPRKSNSYQDRVLPINVNDPEAQPIEKISPDIHLLYETTTKTTLEDQKFLLYNTVVMAFNKYTVREKYLPLLMEQAATCMRLFPHGDSWQEWEKDMYVVYANQMGWFIYEEKHAAEEMELALAIVEEGMQHANWENRKYIHDTKVRILLKLERYDEAFAIVNEALSQDADYADFQDLKTDGRYLAYLTRYFNSRR